MIPNRGFHLRFAVTVVSMLAGLLWLLYLLDNSPGVPVHDELAHYFISRDAWTAPELMLDIWGRPLNTIVYMPGARFGLTGARLSSVAMAVLTVLVTWWTARRLNARYASLVPLLLWCQPWFADYSYAAVTEVPFSLVMVAAAGLLVCGRATSSATLVGLLPLIRHEGIALVALVMVFFVIRKRWRAVIAAAAPIIVYNVLFFLVRDNWPFAMLFLKPKPTDFYGSGLWSHYIPKLALGIGPVVCVLAANALVPVIRSSMRAKVFTLYAVYLLVQIVVYRFGLFGSGGYILFLLPLAPAMALAAALGLEFIVDHGRTWLAETKLSARARERIPAAFIILCVALALVFGLETKPRPMEPLGLLMHEVALWMRSEGLDQRPIVQTNAWLHFFMQDVTERPMPLTRSIAELPKGVIVVWDFAYSERLGLHLDELKKDPTVWRPRADFGRHRLLVFEKLTD